MGFKPLFLYIFIQGSKQQAPISYFRSTNIYPNLNMDKQREYTGLQHPFVYIYPRLQLLGGHLVYTQYQHLSHLKH